MTNLIDKMKDMVFPDRHKEEELKKIKVERKARSRTSNFVPEELLDIISLDHKEEMLIDIVHPSGQIQCPKCNRVLPVWSKFRGKRCPGEYYASIKIHGMCWLCRENDSICDHKIRL